MKKRSIVIISVIILLTFLASLLAPRIDIIIGLSATTMVIAFLMACLVQGRLNNLYPANRQNRQHRPINKAVSLNGFVL